MSPREKKREKKKCSRPAGHTHIHHEVAVDASVNIETTGPAVAQLINFVLGRTHTHTVAALSLIGLPPLIFDFFIPQSERRLGHREREREPLREWKTWPSLFFFSISQNSPLNCRAASFEAGDDTPLGGFWWFSAGKMGGRRRRKVPELRNYFGNGKVCPPPPLGLIVTISSSSSSAGCLHSISRSTSQIELSFRGRRKREREELWEGVIRATPDINATSLPCNQRTSILRLHHVKDPCSR